MLVCLGSKVNIEFRLPDSLEMFNLSVRRTCGLFTFFRLFGSEETHCVLSQVTKNFVKMLFSFLLLSFCGIIPAKLICSWNSISAQAATASMILGEPIFTLEMDVLLYCASLSSPPFVRMWPSRWSCD